MNYRGAPGEQGTDAQEVIIFWHLWGAHLNPDVFPMDSSIFTGKISKGRLRHEHPLEYERLTAKLESPDSKSTPEKTSTDGDP